MSASTVWTEAPGIARASFSWRFAGSADTDAAAGGLALGFQRELDGDGVCARPRR